MSIEMRRVEESMVETVHIVRPNHLNGANRLFGGILMQWIDEVAGVVAKRHSRSNVITASVDNLRFLKGAYQNEVIVIIGKITHVGTTSMEVRVDTYVESADGIRRPINRAYFCMVALDENDKPMPVPRLVIETESEKAEWESGQRRREMRKIRKQEGFLILPAFHLGTWHLSIGDGGKTDYPVPNSSSWWLPFELFWQSELAPAVIFLLSSIPESEIFHLVKTEFLFCSHL